MSNDFYPEIISKAKKTERVNGKLLAHNGYIIEMDDKYYFVETDMDEIDETTPFGAIKRKYPIERVEMHEEFLVDDNWLSVEEIKKERNSWTDIEILMMDYCTRNEAIEHLKDGTQVYRDFEEYFEDYVKEFCDKEEDPELYSELKRMVEEKTPAPDWGVVEIGDKTYYIMYVL